MARFKTYSEFITEKYLDSDAIGYKVGEYIYHVTPISNMDKIKRDGFKPQSGVSINGKRYDSRLYFATSLIAAYDISVNFSSIRDDYKTEYVIFKINADCLISKYEEDPLFVHGIYVDYPIDRKYIVDIIKCRDLFNKFDDQDLENLYENNEDKYKDTGLMKQFYDFPMWYYHATKFSNLPLIAQSGLLPNMDRESNWDGSFEKHSRGKVFVTSNKKQAV